MRSLKTYSDNVTFLLSVIDVLSKYAWDKLTELQTDKDTEFSCAFFQKFLQNQELTFRKVDIKAAIIQRFYRILK